MLGNLGQIFDTAGFQFHLNLSSKYGSVAKVYGMLGVSFVPSAIAARHPDALPTCQDEQIYFTDPLALQQILVKDQDVFEEAEGFRLCAHSPILYSGSG